MKNLRFSITVVLALVFAALGFAQAPANLMTYYRATVVTNAATNTVQTTVFTSAGTFSTLPELKLGAGTGAFPGNQNGAVHVGGLAVVFNGGDRNLSLLKESGNNWVEAARSVKLWATPVSLTASLGNVYAALRTDDGSGSHIVSFTINAGKIVGSNATWLPNCMNIAQIEVVPQGGMIIATCKDNNMIVAIPASDDGTFDKPIYTTSLGGTVPYGFAVRRGADGWDRLVVSDAGESNISLYKVNPATGETLYIGNVAADSGAACWVFVNPDGTFDVVNAKGTVTHVIVTNEGLGNEAITKTSGAACTINGGGNVHFQNTADGKLLIVANIGAGQLQTYRRDPLSGACQGTSPAWTTPMPSSAAGLFVY